MGGLREIIPGLPSSIPPCFFGSLLLGILLGLGEIIPGLPSCFFAGILLCLWKIIPGLAPTNMSTIFHCHHLTSWSNAHSSTSKLFLFLLLSYFLSHSLFTYLPFLLF